MAEQVERDYLISHMLAVLAYFSYRRIQHGVEFLVASNSWWLCWAVGPLVGALQKLAIMPRLPSKFMGLMLPDLLTAVGVGCLLTVSNIYSNNSVMSVAVGGRRWRRRCPWRGAMITALNS